MDIHKIQQAWALSRPDSDAEMTEADFHSVYRRLATTFCPGPCFFYVFDFSTNEFDFISPEYEELMGQSSEEIDIIQILDHIHPRDTEFVMRSEDYASQFFSKKGNGKDPLNYIINYCARMQVADGAYHLFMHQALGLSRDKQGGLAKALGVNVDISHITEDSPYRLSLIGLNGAPSHMNIEVMRKKRPTRSTNPAPPSITPREVEVLSLLAEGARAQDISRMLSIAEPTARKHRENLLKKLKARNTAHLIATAMRKDLI